MLAMICICWNSDFGSISEFSLHRKGISTGCEDFTLPQKRAKHSEACASNWIYFLADIVLESPVEMVFWCVGIREYREYLRSLRLTLPALRSFLTFSFRYTHHVHGLSLAVKTQSSYWRCCVLSFILHDIQQRITPRDFSQNRGRPKKILTSKATECATIWMVHFKFLSRVYLLNNVRGHARGHFRKFLRSFSKGSVVIFESAVGIVL